MKARSQFVKTLWEFLKDTVIAGLFLLLPVILLVKGLTEVVRFTRKIGEPLIKLLPNHVVNHPSFPGLFALAVILLACLIAGLCMRLALAQLIGRWVERYLLNRIPGYTSIKNFTSGLRGSGEVGAFKAAVLFSGADEELLVYLIEDPGNGMATVMVPSAPNAIAGSIRIVPRDRVRILDTGTTAIAKVLHEWGVGAQALVQRERPA